MTGLDRQPTSLPLEAGCEPRCRGCAHRLLPRAQSEAQKERWLRQALHPWRDVLASLQALEGPTRGRYRDRVRLSAAWQDEHWRFGLWARDELIAIPRCPVHSERVRETLRVLAAILPPAPEFPLAFFVQAGAQVTLVLKTREQPSLAWLDGGLRQTLADIGLDGLWLHLHPAAGRRLFAKNGWHLLWGVTRSRDSHGLWHGPAAFQQLLPTLYERALEEAETFLKPGPQDRLVDLYCGTGTTLRRWLDSGARVMGVELAGEAVECARLNASEAVLLRGKCVERIPQLTAWLNEGGDWAGRRLLYVNPPRTGLEPEILAWTTDVARPERIAYLSCSAGTLSRNLAVLTESGYGVERITPYDFFPGTRHVETLVSLRRLGTV
ncbi:MAG: class I SAM-dependent RNA methyltransferase [Gammaproteobacteria bacterium]|nr:class I SAM-dependent RNA methyltransferase [Gammaproteobacteria bacterium]MCP5424603.1 class I SAM-dependent RNA methyltransferase [Gammaproteobacteria bacterium]